MDANLYLELATDLVQRVKQSKQLVGTSGEAECRSAISRAYYAAFHIAVNFLDEIGIKVTDSGDCHVVVQHGFNNSGEVDLVVAGSELRTLYTERKNADYKMGNPRAEAVSQAEMMTVLATKVVGNLRAIGVECGTNPAKRTALAVTMLQWATQSGQQKKLWKK
jgi:uncharacterized protein (UPF0332 family)